MNHEEFFEAYKLSNNKKEDFKFFWYHGYYELPGVEYIVFLESIYFGDDYIDCMVFSYEQPFLKNISSLIQVPDYCTLSIDSFWQPEEIKYYFCKSEEHFKLMVTNIILLG